MAFFDTLKSYGKAQLTKQFPGLSTGLSALSNAKHALQTPAAPTQPVAPSWVASQPTPPNGSFPQMGPMSFPTQPPAQMASFGAPVMPQVKAPVGPSPTYTPPMQGMESPGYTFKPNLSSAQVSSLQSLANKPQEQWTDTDRANWAYGTNNGAMPTPTRPPLPPMDPTESVGQPGAGLPKPDATPQEQPTPQLPPNASPEARKAVEASQALYEKSLQISPEELSSQADLDKLMESARKGFVNAQQQAIPMEFITGQLKSIEDRANALAEPLQTRLARLQAQRTAAITASKFALERADARAAEEKAAAVKAREEEKAQAEQLRREALAQAQPMSGENTLIRLNPKTGKYETIYTAPEKATTSGSFSLSPGESRYDASGNLIATAPASSKAVPTRGLTAEQTSLISQGNNLPSLLNPLLADIDASPNLFGPLQGRFAGLDPTNVAAQTMQAKLNTAALVVGTYLEGGKLAEGDIGRYRTILPQLTDTPEVAKNKLKNVEKLIKDKQAQYFRDFQSAGYDTSGFGTSQQGAPNDPMGIRFNQESQTSPKGNTNVSGIKDFSRVNTSMGTATATGIQGGSSLWKYGLDIVLDGGKGAPVKTPFGGTVVLASSDGGFGNSVKIKMDNGEVIRLSHLDAMKVKNGQRIPPGTIVGTQGSTGKTMGKTGIHVDVTMYRPDGKPYSSQEVASFLNTRKIA